MPRTTGLQQTQGRAKADGGVRRRAWACVLLPVLLGLALPSVASAQWWNASWLNRRPITFDNSASAVNLTTFPVLVRLTSAEIDYAKTLAGGADLRFVDADDATELFYEIEQWNVNDTSIVWVRVPQIDAGSTTDSIWMYYNNTGASDNQTPDSVWANNYAGVWHLDEASGTRFDATGNNNDLSDVNTVGSTSYLLGTGGLFDRVVGEYLEISDAAQTNLDPTGNLTWSAWIRTDTTDQTASVIDKDNGATRGYRIRAPGAGAYVNCTVWDAAGASYGGRSNSQPSLGDWVHVGCVYDGTNVKVYYNGVNETSYAGPVAIGDSPGDFQIGARGGGQWYHGIIDEVRVSTTDRSDDWMEATFRFMSDTAAAPTVGGEQSGGACTGTTFQMGDGKGTASETDDAELIEATPDANSSTGDWVTTDASAHYHSMLKFPNVFGGGANQIPLGATINCATLTLDVRDFTGVNPTVYQLTESWVESEVTWNSRSTGVSWTDPGAEGTSSHKATGEGDFPMLTNGIHSMDVATGVQAWSDGEANEGWIFIHNSSNGADFYTSDYATQGSRPLLTVDYTPGVGTPRLSSEANQTFVVGDPSFAAAVDTIADDATTPTITDAANLRLRIPAGFNMIWDTTVTTVSIGGAASTKVETALLPYEDGGLTLVLDVNTDFLAGDLITVDRRLGGRQPRPRGEQRRRGLGHR
jgi:hypothetical protein